ncbi:Ppx/GppA phosphatase family protein [Paenibacillus sp. NFR01]|uniref:Ppx/GppA phosphatase family protein n=1 Tax=Paenibacillus sp. NFR01 TaxID=1566279 RepID=UPI0008BAF8E8|nr:Ppx/GppA phosphatase family protein [Paenibacillus sp. NFR01]SET31516.1 exopolyphosphatase / guanosine-5'-triphosphate,3'-diphosphate pyrophosphatase [Paenibacillus sp. NFR01]
MSEDLCRIGIIDIGSNSIRLVIYDTTPEGGYKNVKECKYSARLSEKITKDNRLEREAMDTVVPVLRQFKQICASMGVEKIRAGATAAIRNAANSQEIIDYLSAASAIPIEIISGHQEAYFGFLGVINAFDIKDGFVIDIGGGSTEVTLFRGRRHQHSISFPFGAVNTNLLFGHNGNWTSDQVKKLEAYVIGRLVEHDWLTEGEGLPLFGLGGTIRSLGKLDQKTRDYSLPNSHGYVLSGETIEHFMDMLPTMPYDKRKELDGISKSRGDIIVSGLIIFRTVYRYIGASMALISGEGLREGMLHDLLEPVQPVRDSALEYSLGTILRFGSNASREHLEHLCALAYSLLDTLGEESEREEQRKLVYVAVMLHRIGANINYYQSKRHTRYWLMNSPIRGLTHRQLILCALIASYSTKSRKQKLSQVHKDILLASDEEWIHKLGTLVQLAVALDSTEIGMIRGVSAKLHGNSFDLDLIGDGEVLIGLEDIENAVKAFRNVWGLKVKLGFPSNG